MTAFGDIEQAVRLMRAGADDYVIKPFQMDEFLGRIDHLLKRRGIVEGEQKPALGESESMRRIEAVLRRVADIESTLLLTGESGVGKEVAARFVHEISKPVEQALRCCELRRHPFRFAGERAVRA